MRFAWFAAFPAALALSFTGEARAQQPPDADVEIPAAPRAAPPAKPSPEPAAKPAPEPAAKPSPEIEALRREMREDQARLGAQIKALETELAAQRAAPPPPPSPAPSPAPSPPPTAGGATPFASLFGAGAWGLSAYVQAQYESHQDSEDQIQQGGIYLNQDRFLVRRGRLRLDAAWQYAELAIMIDANTTRGLAISAKRLEASVVLRGKPWEGKLLPRGPRDGEPPLAMLTVGLTEIPFGFELLDAHRDRVFMERSLASSAFFPGEQDVGARLTGGVGFFRYALAVHNGEPAGDGTVKPVGDPNKAKDVVLRLGADARPSDALRFAGGVSALYGKGFHAGTDATKDSVQWIDLNQNGVIDPGELTGVPGTAATPSQSFSRWAVGLDVQARLRTKLGWSMLYGEVTLAQNLDRGLFVADPVATGVDVRHLGAYAAFVQEITPYGLVGFRFDYYDPNADFFTKSGGKLLPTSQAIKTLSPVVGLQLPDRARLLFQYDVVRDLLAKDSLGVPTDLRNDHWTLRLQVQL
jgi:hypothetical protein